VETLLIIAQIVVLFSLAGLAIYAILVLVKMRDVLSQVEVNLKEVATRVVPVLENLEVITSRLRGIIENFDDQLALLQHSVETIKGVAENVANFQRRIQDAIEGPVLEVMSTIGGIIRGITSVFTRFRG
jgi:uncharacterized protein YoxC